MTRGNGQKRDREAFERPEHAAGQLVPNHPAEAGAMALVAGGAALLGGAIFAAPLAAGVAAGLGIIAAGNAAVNFWHPAQAPVLVQPPAAVAVPVPAAPAPAAAPAPVHVMMVPDQSQAPALVQPSAAPPAPAFASAAQAAGGAPAQAQADEPAAPAAAPAPVMGLPDPSQASGLVQQPAASPAPTPAPAFASAAQAVGGAPAQAAEEPVSWLPDPLDGAQPEQPECRLTSGRAPRGAQHLGGSAGLSLSAPALGASPGWGEMPATHVASPAPSEAGVVSHGGRTPALLRLSTAKARVAQLKKKGIRKRTEEENKELKELEESLPTLKEMHNEPDKDLPERKDDSDGHDRDGGEGAGGSSMVAAPVIINVPNLILVEVDKPLSVRVTDTGSESSNIALKAKEALTIEWPQVVSPSPIDCNSFHEPNTTADPSVEVQLNIPELMLSAWLAGMQISPPQL